MMQKSFIERVFPKPKRTLLPLYDESPTYQDEETSSSLPGIRLQNDVSSSRLSVTSSGSKTSVKAVPLSASVIHHDDPFLAVDRAARNLQKTIQSLLDFQSQSLGGRTQDDGGFDTGLQSTFTPNQSTTGYSDVGPSLAGTIPIRQPKKKTLSLRGTRRSLTKSMQEFAKLKEEELRIIQGERTHRKSALQRISELETKREAVEHEIHVFQEQASNNEAQTFRSEAEKVEKEIHELEGRLMELQARQRHLIRRAEQVENTTASELSSYKGTLKLVEKETRAFLRRPLVAQALSSRGPALPETNTNMYLLTADRRNLGMAKEQWSTELGLLATQEKDVERDREALQEGAEMWKETIARVEAFEKDLRLQMKETSPLPKTSKDTSTEQDSIANILASLDNTALFLHRQLEKAESQSWNLLICAIGAELEAFREARALLAPDEEPTMYPSRVNRNNDTADDLVQTSSQESESENSDVPHADLLSSNGNGNGTGAYLEQSISMKAMSGALIDTDALRDDLNGSNESLKATLRNLSPSQKPARSISTSANINARTNLVTTTRPQRSATTYSESEDDDPGPEFLLSHQ